MQCEGEKPSCGRCRKAGRVCEGYGRACQFRHLSALDHDALLARSQPLTSLTELSGMLYENLTEPKQDQNSRGTARPREQDPQSPGNTASQAEDLLLDFMYNYSPEGVQANTSCEAPMSWLQAIGPWRRRHSSLDLAMSALLSTVRLGRNRGNERRQREGVAKYGRALKDLQNILASDSLALEEQTLASCMILTIFEACHPIIVCIN